MPKFTKFSFANNTPKYRVRGPEPCSSPDNHRYETAIPQYPENHQPTLLESLQEGHKYHETLKNQYAKNLESEYRLDNRYCISELSRILKLDESFIKDSINETLTEDGAKFNHHTDFTVALEEDIEKCRASLADIAVQAPPRPKFAPHTPQPLSKIPKIWPRLQEDGVESQPEDGNELHNRIPIGAFESERQKIATEKADAEFIKNDNIALDKLRKKIAMQRNGKRPKSNRHACNNRIKQCKISQKSRSYIAESDSEGFDKEAYDERIKKCNIALSQRLKEFTAESAFDTRSNDVTSLPTPAAIVNEAPNPYNNFQVPKEWVETVRERYSKPWGKGFEDPKLAEVEYEAIRQKAVGRAFELPRVPLIHEPIPALLKPRVQPAAIAMVIEAFKPFNNFEIPKDWIDNMREQWAKEDEAQKIAEAEVEVKYSDKTQ